MSDLTKLSLQRFTQKIAGQVKQANPLAALTPNVLGGLGGAALGGLGLYGIARATQSEEDKKRRSMTPALAGLAGALAGGAGGAIGVPKLLEMLKQRAAMADTLSNAARTSRPLPEISNTVDGPRDLQTHPQISWPHTYNRGAKDTSVTPESAAYLENADHGLSTAGK